MKRKIPFAISAGLLALLLTLTLSAAHLSLSAETFNSALAVAVFPRTLLLNHDEGTSVTVCAKIPFRRVKAASLTLNGIRAKGANPDKRGNLVAYFDAAAVERTVSAPYATLNLQGATTRGGTFRGSGIVQVLPVR